MQNIVERLIALILLIILSPLFILVSIIVAVDLKANPIFKQYRMGINGKKFSIYKFRTFKPNAPQDIPTDEIVDYSEYSTRVCLLLRALSIDELPQLINIVKGDMSFIGPRPVMLNENELNFKRLELGIYNIRPGVTGWAQINGRDKLEIDDKIKFDLEYIKNKSFKFDIYILLKTIEKVFKREDVKL